MRRTAAFTLIEMLIAVALSTGVVLIATAGVRIAAQAIATTNRLATENALLGSGLITALDEIDYWGAYDDPVDATKTRLRATGMPFAPFSTAFPGPAGGAFAGVDADRGWNADFAWPASDARTWWSGNHGERCTSSNDLRMGAYNQFFCTTALQPRTRTWLANQMNGLKTALGYQGLCEYMPANALYGYYVPVSAGSGKTQTDLGGLYNEISRSGWFNNGDGGTQFPIGLFRLSKDNSFALPPLAAIGNTPSTTADYAKSWTTGDPANTGTMTTFYRANLSRTPLLATGRGPAIWPTVSVAVMRYVSYNRMPCICTVGWTDPLSGAAHSLSFSAIGTTLRGARMQRRPGAAGSAPGWAKWVAAGDPGNDPTLDRY